MTLQTGYLDMPGGWGPFSPAYLGLSRILDAGSGSIVDFSLFVGRRSPARIVLPDSTFDHVQNMKEGDRRAKVEAVAEDVRTDYSSFAIRYFIDAHGDAALARFRTVSDREARCEITFHNSSDEAREYFYGVGCVARDASPKVALRESFRPWWLPARNYQSLHAYQKAFGLGSRQCLTRVFNWAVEDQVLAQAFGGWSEDHVTYRMVLPEALRDGFLYFRYIKYGELNPAWELRVNGKPIRFHFSQTWAIPGGGWGKNRDTYEEWRLLRIPIGEISDREVTIELRPLEAPGNDLARIWLDGMLFHEGLLPGDTGELSPATLIDAPLRQSAFVEPEASSDEGVSFRAVIDGEPTRRITLASDQKGLRMTGGTGSFLAHLRERFHLPPARLVGDANIPSWGLVESESITIAPHSEATLAFSVCLDGGVADKTPSVEQSAPPLAAWNGPYAVMTRHLADALLFNINYPLNLFGRPSSYYVPAKYFPIPYSWDGGFIALGLASFAPERAWQQTAYFFADQEHDFAHLYAGSPVPTPLYALWECYQATQNLTLLKKTYAGARRMYDFYLGRTPGSEVNLHQDGFLSTYAYNYNLGIDDHPIQRWAEENHLTSKGLYSIILMPQILRMAQIMRNIACLLDLPADAEQYRKDALLLGDNIESHMWDEASGLYGWARRTEDGVEPVVFHGSAGDHSACAFLPLFAGLTSHKERLLEQLQDPERFFTPFGISSVDMQCAYYNPNGYWNGGIWPVLQWYLWRGLLEAGEPALARRIAENILQTWSRFFESDHYLGEHYMIAPGQMNGAPNFGGLSGVLLPMQAAYFTPYQVTTCYDVIISRKNVDLERDEIFLQFKAPYLSKDSHDLLLNMGRSNASYDIVLNGQLIGTYSTDMAGHLSLRLPSPKQESALVVRPSTAAGEKP